jgi:ATP/maltotriose-dependent transcriptional regulator MalT
MGSKCRGYHKEALEMDPDDISINGSDILDNYQFYECIRCLTDEIADFLKASACFEELDPVMLDAVTGSKNSLLILNSLVKRNIFTIKTKGEQFRHHTLFRNFLLKSVSPEYQKQLEHKAALYYYKRKQYSKAAKYAMLANEKALLEKIILECYEDYINNGNFSELRSYFSEARVWLDNVKPKKDLTEINGV